jgi:hypothetical protein
MLEKSVMLVFLGTKRSWEFFGVSKKKSKKSEKMRFFRKKAYGLGSIFAYSRITIYHVKNEKISVKKKRKKKGFSFFETFFFKWKLDIFLSIFEIKKKVLKFFKLSIFSISLNYLVKWKVIGRIYSFIWKNYKKILEKSNSCFQTIKNSFRVFWGSFDKFIVFSLNF